MAVIDIPQGISAYTFEADSRDVFTITANMLGNTTTNGATDFTINNKGSLTGRVTDTLSVSGFILKLAASDGVIDFHINANTTENMQGSAGGPADKMTHQSTDALRVKAA